MTVLVTTAVESELSLLKSELNALPAGCVAGRTYFRGRIGDLSIFLSDVGVGVVSAALTLGALVAQSGVSRIIICGSAGAFDNSGLKIGDLAVVSSEALAELGLYEGPGIGSAAALGLHDLDQEIDLDSESVELLVRGATDVAEAHVVRSLTVLGVSADLRQARTRSDRFRTSVENMEGYAAALVGLRSGIPVGEIRGISNVAGNRDKSTWNLALACERAQVAVLNCLRELAKTEA